MPGERTPETPGAMGVDNLISLREHLQRQIDAQAFHFNRLLAEHRVQLDERYTTQTKALEAAFAAADKAVSAALISAEKAVTKAEAAAERRFEAANEFRGQLSEQASTFMPRSEAQVQNRAVLDRMELLNNRIGDLELRLSKRLDLTQGSAAGVNQAWGWIIGAVGLAAAVVAIVVGLR